MSTPSREMSCRPFALVPWDTDFLDQLLALILADTGNQPGKALVLFPHDRAGRYLTHLLQHAPGMPRPCIAPRILTVSEAFSTLRAERDSTPFPSVASLPDKIALLARCVRELAVPGSELCERLAHMDDAAFFPWGARLAEVMDECFQQGLEPADILYAEEEVAPFGAALLASLGRLFQQYQHALLAHELTTPGFDAFRVLGFLDDRPSFLDAHTVYVAGFNALTGTEEALFRHLWERGARICLHGDPALAHEASAAHWSCAAMRQWLERFNTPCELVCPPSGSRPALHFFAGFDLHSQLEALTGDLGADAGEAPQRSSGDTAIVLPHSDALLPVLHHLPDKDCNISLGYPLERSQVFQLLDTLMELRTLSGHGAAHPADAGGTDIADAGQLVHWRPLLDVLRHPLVRMLEVEGQSLRPLLDRMERTLRKGGRYADLDLLVAQACSSPDLADPAFVNGPVDLFNRFMADAVLAWRAVRTPADLGNALTRLCETLLAGGTQSAVWKRFPLDAESLFRVMQRVAPALRDNLMAVTPLPWPLLRTMLHELMLAERVPFEADPLTGLQVLGMLETRLLRFRRVFLLDATDDRLPGTPSRSPLLPDSLRAVLGLPDTRHRDEVAAYTFHRLLAGATDVFLYWQEGVDPSALFDGKKQRSRFIEALIWREEQRQGLLCRPGVPPLRAASPQLVPPRPERREVERTPAMDHRMRALLARPLFATTVDAYLSCPLRFYFEHLCRLRPADEVNEDDDPAAVGAVLHTALKRFYDPFAGQHVARSQLDADELIALFTAEAEASGLMTALPPESAAMLMVAGPERLRRYLNNQPESTHILHLEQRFEAPLTVHGITIPLAGVLDRVDVRDAGAVVLDYKTGRLKTVPGSFWHANIWPSLEYGANTPEAPLFTDPEADLLPELARLLPSVQLPWYVHVYGQASQQAVADAAFVELAVDGREVSLFGTSGHNAPPADNGAALATTTALAATNAKDVDHITDNPLISHNIPILLRFLTGHMLSCTAFRPRESPACDWCLWKNLCML